MKSNYGSVYKMKDKPRRNPWRVVKTIKELNGKVKRQTIGYTRTKVEGLELLAKYNTNPYSLDTTKMTFREVLEKWQIQHFEKLEPKTIKQYKSICLHFEPIKDIPMLELNTIHLQGLFNSLELSTASKRQLKAVLNQIYKYALKMEIVSKDYSNLIELGKKQVVIERKVFTNEEITKLWKYKELEFVDTILIMIYTGLRIGELLTIENKNIDLENRTIKGGIKTDAGKDRIIPINMEILPLIKNRMRADKTHLITGTRGKKMAYQRYHMIFTDLMEKLNMNHTIHDCRHTFASLLSNADANKISIAKIIGHSSYLTTEKIYTHKDVEELKKAVDLIKLQ